MALIIVSQSWQILTMRATEYRIVYNKNIRIDNSVVQADRECYYSICEENGFDENTIYRIGNIYSVNPTEKLRVYAQNNHGKLPALIFEKIEKIQLTENEYLFYFPYSSRVSFHTNIDFELPEFKAENIEKIVLATYDGLIEEIDDFEKIESFLQNIDDEFENLEKEYKDKGEAYFCYFYYKNTYMYEEITTDYLEAKLFD